MSDTAVPIGLFDRAIRRIAGVWRDMASTVTVDEEQGIIGQMRACLHARGGEISARNRAAKLAQTYLGLDDAGRRAFLLDLASFDSDPVAIETAYEAVQATIDPAQRALAVMALRRALEPPRVRLLTQFTTIPDGMKFLVDLRVTLLRLIKDDPTSPRWRAICAACSPTGSTSASSSSSRSTGTARPSLLERLVGYEAVHEIRSWTDLKNRLDSDRRCYAFFHPRMPNEPLIFVEVALVHGLASQRAAPARQEGAAARPAAGRHRDLLLDQQLPARPGRHQLRQFPDQAGGRAAEQRVPQYQDLRDALAHSGFPPLARRQLAEEIRRC